MPTVLSRNCAPDRKIAVSAASPGGGQITTVASRPMDSVGGGVSYAASAGEAGRLVRVNAVAGTPWG